MAAIASSAACAQESTTAITGGGSASAAADYYNEFATFNAGRAAGAATFANPAPATGQNILYWASGGSGQTAFLNNDLSCDSNKVLNQNGGNCSGTVGGAASVSYAASDSPLTSTQISGWATSPVGQAAAGNLIQIPSMGTGEAIPIVNSKVTANGQVSLTDGDLCGIFSGKITDWSKTTAKAGLAAGPIFVVYRSDTSGATFLFLNHLSAVCTTANSNFAPVTPSTTFASVFPNGVVPANFVGVKGTLGVANYLASQAGVTVTSAIGYVTPDYTTVDPKSNAVLANGQPSPLVVAALKASAKSFLPTVTNIALALNHPKLGQNLTPPTTATDGANPSNYVPVIQTVSEGYPIVGYTTFDLPQCYASATIKSGVLSYLRAHYSTAAAYQTSIHNNGLVSITNSGARAFATVIKNAILSNKNGWKVDIGDATACKGLTGR